MLKRKHTTELSSRGPYQYLSEEDAVSNELHVFLLQTLPCVSYSPTHSLPSPLRNALSPSARFHLSDRLHSCSRLHPGSGI